MGARFKILGHTGLLIDDQFDDQWGHPKLRGLLAALLLNAGRAVTHDALIEWVWPEDKGPQQAKTTVYTYISRIRDILNQMVPPPRLVADRGAYYLAIDKTDVDFYTFRDLVEQARKLSQHGDHQTARDWLATAVSLWSERPLADLDGERAARWRQWAETELLIPAHEDLLRELAVLGEFDEVLRRLADPPVEHAANLTLMKRRMEALFGLHRVKEATTYFLSARKQLRAEFDQAEADELTRFHDDLLHERQRHTNPATGAINTSQPPPQFVPPGIPDFAGRSELLEQLDRVVAAHTPDRRAVVVLEGAPGVGKSALAVHWANRSARWFPGGQLYLGLAGFSGGPRVEPQAAIEQLLVQLGFPTNRTTTAVARVAKLRSLLSVRQALVVLDNVASTEHVQPLLDCLPCTILITSRRHLTGLGRRGATAITVPPLSYQESYQWLATQLGARAVQDPDALDELTALCGGNMLALRLVGVHATSRPHVRLAEFAEELRDEQALLDLGDDDDNPDGSVRAAFSLSYQALNAEQQRLFRFLGTHPGSDINLDAAAALAGEGRGWTKRRLDALVGAHLLEQLEQRSRYRLHDLVRKYAAKCGTSTRQQSEQLAAEQRLLSYYHHGAHNADRALFPHRVSVPTQEVVDGVTPPVFADGTEAFNWLIRERINLNAIVHFANKRSYHAYVTTMASSIGETYQQLGYYEDVLATLHAAVHAAEASGDSLGYAYSLSNLGYMSLKLRDFASAESYFRRAKAQYDGIGFAIGSAMSIYHFGWLHVAKGEYRLGVEAYRAGLEALRDIDASEARGLELLVLRRLSEACRHVHDLDDAVVCAREALWQAEKLGDRHAQAASLTELAAAFYAHHDIITARGYCRKAMALQKPLPDPELAGQNWQLLGVIHSDEGDLEQAESCLRNAIRSYHEARHTTGEAAAYDLLGSVLYRQAEHDDAVQAWSSALAIFEDMTDSPRADAVRLRLAEAANREPADPPGQARRFASDRAPRN